MKKILLLEANDISRSPRNYFELIGATREDVAEADIVLSVFDEDQIYVVKSRDGRKRSINAKDIGYDMANGKL